MDRNKRLIAREQALSRVRAVTQSDWKPLKHGVYLCPTCNADLLDVTGIRTRGLKRICVGPATHRWQIPPVEEIYPDMPTHRQRAVLSVMYGYNWAVHFLPDTGHPRGEFEDQLRGIRTQLDALVLVTEYIEYEN